MLEQGSGETPVDRPSLRVPLKAPSPTGEVEFTGSGHQNLAQEIETATIFCQV